MADPPALVLDPTSFDLSFRASLGPLPVRGTFRRLTGTLTIPPDGIERATLTIDVEAASIDTALAMRDAHLRGRSFLDVATHPRISYTLRQVTRDNGDLLVAGTLTLRGIARDVRTRCTLAQRGEGASATVTLAASLDIPCREHGVGVPVGLDRLNPIFLVVGPRVLIRAAITVPANRLLPALLPALER